MGPGHIKTDFYSAVVSYDTEAMLVSDRSSLIPGINANGIRTNICNFCVFSTVCVLRFLAV